MIIERLSARQLILHLISESVCMYVHLFVRVLHFRNAINFCVCTNDVIATSRDFLQLHMQVGVDFMRCACSTLSSTCSLALTIASKDAEISEKTKRLATLRKRKQEKETTKMFVCTQSYLRGANEEFTLHCKYTDGQSSTWHCPSCACMRPYLCIRISSVI